MVLSYVNGASTSSTTPYVAADVPGLILAASFGAYLYFMTRKNVKLDEGPFYPVGFQFFYSFLIFERIFVFNGYLFSFSTFSSSWYCILQIFFLVTECLS